MEWMEWRPLNLALVFHKLNMFQNVQEISVKHLLMFSRELYYHAFLINITTRKMLNMLFVHAVDAWAILWNITDNMVTSSNILYGQQEFCILKKNYICF